VRLSELAARLDALFDVARFEEVGGWDFALSRDETGTLLQHAGPGFLRTFNGLLCAPVPDTHEVTRVYLLVFPEAGLLDRVIGEERRRGSPGAIVVTHHPCDMETSGRGFVAIPSSQLAALTEARTAIYALHAPLDCHSTISTSGALADGLGLRRVRTFAPYYAGNAGVIGEQPPESFSHFAERVRALCELSHLHADQIRFAGRPVARVAILAGGGDDLDALREAERLGADTYLAGHWWTPHPGPWCDANRAAIAAALPTCRMNLFGASHDGSELVVFRDRLAPLFRDWGLPVELVRQDDHWR
jgi:putative NIF3 family GTP cyclohydrolase 1 type 2